jgi:hypothetical protein
LGGKKIMKKTQKQLKFYVLNQPKKKLTKQQKKVQQLANISHRCLRSKESPDKASLFKCVQDEAERQLATL